MSRCSRRDSWVLKATALHPGIDFAEGLVPWRRSHQDRGTIITTTAMRLGNTARECLTRRQCGGRLPAKRHMRL